MRATWLLALLALACGATWWLLAREASEETGDAGSASVSRAAPAPGADGPTLEGVLPRAPAPAGGAGGIQGKVTRDGAPAEAEITLRLLASAARFERRDEDFAALLEAMFRLEPAPLAAPLRTLHATGGVFIFEGLGPGIYRVSARTAQGLEASAMAGLLEDRLRADVLLALATTDVTLEGRVVWSDGRPVGGRVVVEGGAEGGMPSGLAEAWGPTELDAEGRFRSGGLRAGPVALRILTSEGVLAIEHGVVVPAKEPVVVTLEAPAQELRGRVVSALDESPVAGAAVLAVFDGRRGDQRWQRARATSAADGSFSVLAGHLPAQVIVRAADFDQAQPRVQEAEGVVVRLRPHGTVRGRVVSALDRSPVQGAVVVVSGLPPKRATTGPDGRFEITGVAGRSVTAIVRGGGWTSPYRPGEADADYDSRHYPFVPGQPLEIELEAAPSASLEGRVLDQAGAAVAGARVSVSDISGSDHFADHGMLDPQVSTAEDGRFTLQDLPPGAAVELSVRVGSAVLATSGGHVVGGPPVEIRLSTARWVEVTALFSDDDSPVVGASVDLTAHTDGGTYGVSGQRTDAQGRARGQAPRPGPLTVRLRSDALARGQPATPVPGSEGQARDLRVTVRAQRGLELRGRVLLPDGRPAERVLVRATTAQADPRPWEARTEHDGRFVLLGASTGEIELQVNVEVGGAVLRGHGRFRAGSGEVELRLADVSQEFITLHVRVLDSQGKPVPRARVQALWGDRGGESTEIAQGEARWRTARGSDMERALAAGTLTLEAAGARTEDGTPLPFGPVRVGPLRADQREVVLRLVAERVIEGRVLDADGRAVPGLLLEAERAVPRWGQGFGQPEVRTDAQGRFRIGGLDGEERRLVVRVSGDYLAPEPQVLVPGGPALEIRLERGRSVRVRVTAPDGAALAGAQVSAQPRQPSRTRDMAELERAREEGQRAARSTQSGPDGVAHLRGLDPALAWNLGVTPPQGRDDLRSWSSPTWSPADTDVRLEAALSVRGFVRDASGAPLPGAFVYAQGGDGGWQGFPAGPGGAFRVKGLIAGEQVRLLAVASQGQYPDFQAEPLATVPAGSTGVVLVVEAGATLTLELSGFAPGSPRAQPRIMKVGGDGALTPALHGQPTADGGLLRYEGFSPALALTIWVGPDEQDRYGLVRDVRAGGPVVRVEAQVGGVIRGTLRVPPGGRDPSVSAQQGGLHVGGSVDASGAYVIRGLPPGRWTIFGSAVLEERHALARGEVDVGGTLDLAPTASQR